MNGPAPDLLGNLALLKRPKMHMLASDLMYAIYKLLVWVNVGEIHRKYKHILLDVSWFLATLVALRFTPVSRCWLAGWAEFRTSVASRLASLFNWWNEISIKADICLLWILPHDLKPPHHNIILSSSDLKILHMIYYLSVLTQSLPGWHALKVQFTAIKVPLAINIIHKQLWEMIASAPANEC